MIRRRRRRMLFSPLQWRQQQQRRQRLCVALLFALVRCRFDCGSYALVCQEKKNLRAHKRTSAKHLLHRAHYSFTCTCLGFTPAASELVCAAGFGAGLVQQQQPEMCQLAPAKMLDTVSSRPILLDCCYIWCRYESVLAWAPLSIWRESREECA